MDYRAFYAEIASWIEQANQMAVAHGMDSDDFWRWVMSSAVQICARHGNNPLVLGQMSFLYLWLEDVYSQSLQKSG